MLQIIAFMGYQEINSKTIDRWVDEGWEYGKRITHETYIAATKGDYTIYLTCTKPVPKDWIGDVKGKKVFGLASGGAQQMPVFAALGAECTILDYSERQCESERVVAEREGYNIDVICGDMTKPLPFADETFDLICHPVSNNYIEDPIPVFKECYRILKKGGRLICGLDNGTNYMFDSDEKTLVNSFPFNPLKNPAQMKQLIDEDCGVQFSHTAEVQIGGQLKAGFILKDIFEDVNDKGRLAELNIPSYWATLAIK